MATVPSISGIINLKFGAKYITALYGLVFFIHQIGAFFGAYLGGVLFEKFSSYNPIWTIDIFFCALASIIALQLLAYHTAVIRGCDVDKPRNLAKSVTVEWFIKNFYYNFYHNRWQKIQIYYNYKRVYTLF